MAAALALWAPVILRHLPSIIRAVQDMYATFCTMRGRSHQNSTVIKALQLLMKHQNNLHALFQNPNEKTKLVEGLTILINRINQNGPTEGGGAGEARGYGYNARALGPPPPSSSSSSSEYPSKGRSWKICDVCLSQYNFTNKKPTILACGHTFCRECLREIFNRTNKCPTCRQRDARPFSSLAPNVELLRLLEEKEWEEDEEEEEDFRKKDDKSSCVNGGASGCSDDIPLSCEAQIQYAIFLSMQTAQSQGPEYVEAKWKEVEWAEDEMLAQAIQLSEFYEDSRVCAQRQQDECAQNQQSKCSQSQESECAQLQHDECAQNQQPEYAPREQNESAMNLPDKEKEEREGMTGDGYDEEEASLQLAIKLHYEEIDCLQRQHSSDGNSAIGGGGDSEPDSHWLKQYHHYIGSSSYDPSEEDRKNTSGQDERNVAQTGEDEDANDGDAALCCGRGDDDDDAKKDDDGGECQTEGTSECEPTNCYGSEDDGECCSRSQEEWKKDYGDVCCGEDDELEKKRRKEKCSSIMKEQEDALMELALQMSLKEFQQNGAEKDGDV